MSLIDLRKVDESGWCFARIDGNLVRLTPGARSDQALLGSDIAMQLDRASSAGRAGRGSHAPAVATLGGALQALSKGRRPDGRFSASCRVATTGGCGQARARWSPWASTATRRRPRGRQSGTADHWRWSEEVMRICQPTGRILMGVGTPDDILGQSRAASTCSTACCRPATAAMGSRTRSAHRSECATPGMTPARAESRCPAARDYSRAYRITWSRRERRWRHCSPCNLYLPGPDAGHAYGDRTGPCGLPPHDSGRLGARRHRAALTRKGLDPQAALAQDAHTRWTSTVSDGNREAP